MTEERLAQRYHALLAFYPRWWRAERGEELVGTLLDAARPGQIRPTWREARSLVLEGLRTRAAHDSTLVDALRTTVLLILLMWALSLGNELIHAGPTFTEAYAVVAMAVFFGVVPFVLVAMGRFGSAMAVLAAGELVGVVLLLEFGAVVYHYLVFPTVAMVGLAVLQRHAGGRAGAGTLVGAVVPPLLLAVPAWFPFDGPIAPTDLFWYGQLLPLALMYLGAIAYVAVDPRPALGLAAFFMLVALQLVTMGVTVGVSIGTVVDAVAVHLVAAVVAAVAAGLALRRQVAAVPAKIEG